VRGVAIEDLGELAEAAGVEDLFGAAEVGAGGGDGGGGVIPGAGEGFAEDGEGPGPGGAVVIGGFAAGVLMAFVTRPVGVMGVIEQAAVVAVDGESGGDGERGKGAQGAGDDEVLLGGGDAAFGPVAGDEAEADEEQAVAAEGVADGGVAGDDAGVAEEDIGIPAGAFEPEQLIEGGGGAGGEFAPFFLIGGGGEFFHLPEQADPEGLDFYGIAFARGAGGVVGVHPGEMTGAPDEAGIQIGMDAVGRAVQVMGGDAEEDIGDGASGSVDGGLVEAGVGGGQGFADDAEPERGVGGVTVGDIVAVDGIGQGAAVFEAREGEEELFDFGDQAGGEQAAGADQGIAAPI